MAGCCCAKACTAAVLIGVMRLPGYPFDSAWCFVCEVCLLMVDWVDGHRQEMERGGCVSMQSCSSSLKAENWSGSAPLQVF